MRTIRTCFKRRKTRDIAPRFSSQVSHFVHTLGVAVDTTPPDAKKRLLDR